MRSSSWTVTRTRSSNSWLRPSSTAAARVPAPSSCCTMSRGLRKLEVVRSDFVANVSHELKTPFTVILGTVETMLEDAESMPDEIRQRFLGKVLSQSHRFSSLVSDLLVLSRVESAAGCHGLLGCGSAQRSSSDSMSGLLPVAEEKSIRFEKATTQEPAVISGDAEALQAGHRQSARQRTEVLRATESASRPGSPGAATEFASRSRTQGSGSRRRISSGSSNASTASTRRAPVSSAAPGSGSPSSNTSSWRTAAKSVSTVLLGRGSTFHVEFPAVT